MDYIAETIFSDSAPHYDRDMVDTALSMYCTVKAITAEQTVTRNVNGIVVTKRKLAILHSLSAGKPQVQIFGDLELGIARDNI